MEGDPPLPGHGSLYCTPPFSGGEGGRRALRSLRSNDLAVCAQHWFAEAVRPGVGGRGVAALAVPTEGCISVVRLPV